MTAPTLHQWEWRPGVHHGTVSLHCDGSSTLTLSAIGSPSWRVLTESLPGLATLHHLRAGDIDQVPAPTPAQVAEALDDDGLAVLWQMPSDGRWQPYVGGNWQDRAAENDTTPRHGYRIIRADPPSLADRLREWADCISPAADADLLREAADALDATEGER